MAQAESTLEAEGTVAKIGEGGADVVGESGSKVVRRGGEGELNIGEAGSEVGRDVVAVAAGVSSVAFLALGDVGAKLDVLDAGLMVERAAL